MLSKDKNVAQHRVDNVDEADEGDEARVAALESNCLTHYTDCVEACGAEKDHVVEGVELEDI